MAESYCGKNCEECKYKIEESCPGCKIGPGGCHDCDCDIARCCHEKGHFFCADCTFASTCHTVRRKENIPEEREAIKRGKERLEREKKEKSVIFGKWLRIGFFILIATNILSLLGNIPVLFTVSGIVSTVGIICYAAILLKISAENERFRWAGIGSIIGTTGNFIAEMISGGPEIANWTLIFTIPCAAIAIFAYYQEIKGYSEIIYDYDKEFSEKWEHLWKWYIGAYAVSFGSVIVALIAPGLSLLVIFAAMVAILVTEIIKLVYLYRQYNIYLRYTGE